MGQVVSFQIAACPALAWLDIGSFWPAAVYLIVTYPLLLPSVLSLMGLRTTPVDEIDGSWELNKAGQRKMEELRRERERRDGGVSGMGGAHR